MTEYVELVKTYGCCKSSGLMIEKGVAPEIGALVHETYDCCENNYTVNMMISNITDREYVCKVVDIKINSYPPLAWFKNVDENADEDDSEDEDEDEDDSEDDSEDDEYDPYERAARQSYKDLIRQNHDAKRHPVILYKKRLNFLYPAGKIISYYR